METCKYKEVLEDAGIAINCEKNSTWKPVLRQLMICFSLWCMYFINGLYLGAPTVLIAQIRREANSTDAVSDEMSSWLSSLPSMAAAPFLLIATWLCYKIGRKFSYLAVCLAGLSVSIIFYNSSHLYHVLVSVACMGPSIAAGISFIPIMVAEYTSPQYRGIFSSLMSASAFWGIWVSNAIGTFFYWKNIALVGFVSSSYMITVFAWPESPYWLAMKGRYAESAKAHRWLKGTSVDSEMELAKMIKQCKTISLSKDVNDSKCLSYFSSAWSTVTSPTFYKPTILCIALFAQYQFTGKFVISVYAIDVFKNLTQDESVAYKGMLTLDGVTVFSMYGGCILSRYFKRKTLLILFTSIGILFLFTMFLYSYLVSLSVIQENHVVIVVMLTIFSIVIGCGPMILSSCIYGEIVPSRYQSSVMLISGIGSIIIASILFKLSPFMFKCLKMHGCFLFYAISSTVLTVFLYFYLPETKDKTIYEIEEHFSNKQKSKEQCSTLLNTVELN